MLNMTALRKLALGGLYYSGAYHLLKNNFSGAGLLLTLHHVAPGKPTHQFSPNRILKVSPEFLEATIIQVRDLGYEIVSLDELHQRLSEYDFRKRFLAFTLDDGYADNFHYAYPIFKKHDVPFAIYLCTGLLDGSVDLWWKILEEIVFKQDRIEVLLGGTPRVLESKTTIQKYKAYEEIYWSLRCMELKIQLETFEQLTNRYTPSVDNSVNAEETLTWQMISEMQRSGLLTIGAHTVNHYALSKLAVDDARSEITKSRNVIEQNTGKRPVHFAYPYGDVGSAAKREFDIVRELGFATAVTTRKGVIFSEHAEHQEALPRVSLNGDYQHMRNVKLFASGLPFAISNRFQRLNVS